MMLEEVILAGVLAHRLSTTQSAALQPSDLGSDWRFNQDQSIVPTQHACMSLSPAGLQRKTE